jgi:hypothetical protein
MKKDKIVRLRLSAIEKEYLYNEAKKQKISMSKLIRQAIKQ